MKSIEEIKKILKDHKRELRNLYGIKRIGIFGSYIRNEQKKKSDIDIIAEFERPLSLLDIVRIEIHLKKVLKQKVDLVPKEDIRPELKKGFLKKRSIYE